MIFLTAASRRRCCATSRFMLCSSRLTRGAAALAGIVKPTVQDYPFACDRKTVDLVASFQRAIVQDLVGKTLAAARACDVATLFVTGGVAANNELRQTFEQRGAEEGLPVFFPSRKLSTDNAAMIAAAAYPKFLAEGFCCDGFFGGGESATALAEFVALLPSALTQRLFPSPRPRPFPAEPRISISL